ncbi:uncharacterized protein LOC129945858 [Eupeodes corollae]|uniref:uncharacterized protein LOC129945858 n=1 Tax=Eupeodes corollae TaxID=290404 RepID=UPI002492C895|nr:uncharacterized protein LOC129945858 [Eupeodes corollae]
MLVRKLFIIFWMMGHQTLALYVPQDVEILDGYDFEESPEYYQSDSAYYEARSLAAAGNFGQSKSIRNRRSTAEYDAAKASNTKSKKKDIEQNVDSDKIEVVDKKNPSGGRQMLPKAEKQVMEPNYYRKDSWNDYSWNIKRDDDDSVSDASNDGFRRRQPRVNFVTQPKKVDLDPKDRTIVKISPPQLKPHYDDYEPYKYEMYPSRSYDQYLRRYDRYDEQYDRDPYNYDEHYLFRRHYDPYDSYSPRVPNYPEAYYNYPDRRFDVPEPRDYGSLYNNEIYDRPSSYDNRNRRIVYYAHLPEIVRPPPGVDYSNHYDRGRYDSNRRNPEVTIPIAYKVAKESETKDSYGFVKREKKDHRNSATVSPSKSPSRE